jgi:predicted nuclease with TOPRIM domain
MDKCKKKLPPGACGCFGAKSSEDKWKALYFMAQEDMADIIDTFSHQLKSLNAAHKQDKQQIINDLEETADDGYGQAYQIITDLRCELEETTEERDKLKDEVEKLEKKLESYSK